MEGRELEGLNVGGSASKKNAMGEAGAPGTLDLWSSPWMRIWVLHGRKWEVIRKHGVSFFFLTFSYGRHMGPGGTECGWERLKKERDGGGGSSR